MSKRVKIVFLASLVLNLLLAGVIAGLAPRHLDARPARQERLEAALRSVPEPTQSRLRDHFSQLRAAADPLRRELEQARAEALRLLSVEPFDESAYDSQLNKAERLRAEMFRRTGQLLKQQAKQLSPDERKMLAEVLRRPQPERSTRN
jgi:uncharacterized membrane protein